MTFDLGKNHQKQSSVTLKLSKGFNFHSWFHVKLEQMTAQCGNYTDFTIINFATFWENFREIVEIFSLPADLVLKLPICNYIYWIFAQICARMSLLTLIEEGST